MPFRQLPFHLYLLLLGANSPTRASAEAELANP